MVRCCKLELQGDQLQGKCRSPQHNHPSWFRALEFILDISFVPHTLPSPCHTLHLTLHYTTHKVCLLLELCCSPPITIIVVTIITIPTSSKSTSLLTQTKKGIEPSYPPTTLTASCGTLNGCLQALIVILYSLIPRPFPVFQCCTMKNGKAREAKSRACVRLCNHFAQ